jgi:hypothetical protein
VDEDDMEEDDKREADETPAAVALISGVVQQTR